VYTLADNIYDLMVYGTYKYMSGSDADNNSTDSAESAESADSADSANNVDQVNRMQKVTSVLEYLKYAPDNEIDNIYTLMLDASNKAAKTVKSTKPGQKVYAVTQINVQRKIRSDAINAEKVKVLLKLTNEILQAVGKDPISDITKFNIKRDEITSKAVEAIVLKADYLYKDALYDRRLCGWYYRKNVQSFPITLMKALIKQTDGYIFMSKSHRTKDSSYTAYIIAKVHV